MFDDAEKFTSEMHDPALVAVAYKREQHQKHLTGGTGVEPAKHPSKVKSEVFLQL